MHVGGGGPVIKENVNLPLFVIVDLQQSQISL